MSNAVGIIIPAYNVGRYLEATLDSIVAQTILDWRCIVVDDGSTDDTAAVGDRYASRDRRIRVLRQNNAGPCVARNRAFNELSDDVKYVAFMDSDDIYEPDALQALREETEKNPPAIGTHGLADMIDADGAPLNPGTFAAMGRARLGYDGRQVAPWPAERETGFEVLLHASKVYPPGLVLARREVYAKAGPWDARIPIAADWDMLLRITRHGKLRFLNRVILKYRRHPGNISNQLAKNYAEIRYLYHKTFFAEENSREQRELLRGGWRAWQVYKMREKWAAACRQLADGQFMQATKAAAHVPAHAWRWARGYPTARGL